MGKLKKSDLEKLLKSEDPNDYVRFWNDHDLIVRDYGKHAVWAPEGLDVEETMKKIPSANEEELKAFMTMIFRESHFSGDRLERRFKQGWPQKIVERLMKFAE